jgi:hypothetical protein
MTSSSNRRVIVPAHLQGDDEALNHLVSRPTTAAPGARGKITTRPVSNGGSGGSGKRKKNRERHTISEFEPRDEGNYEEHLPVFGIHTDDDSAADDEADETTGRLTTSQRGEYKKL